MVEVSAARSSTAADKIIVALDVSDPLTAKEIVDELKGSVGAFKIGLQLFCSAGPGLVRELVSGEAKIFLDLKFHDIPNTVAQASAEAARLGVWMFNVHALGGAEMMRAAREAAASAAEKEGLAVPRMIAVTLLTSSNEGTLREAGIEGGVERSVLRYSRLAAKCGLDGVVASAREAKLLRSDTETAGLLIVTPGIRPRTATNDDQKRVMTPGEAILSGADHIVIGRPITASRQRRDAVADIVSEIGSVLV